MTAFSPVFGSHARTLPTRARPHLRRTYHASLLATAAGHVLELRRGVDVVESDKDGNVTAERHESWRMPVVNLGDRLIVCGATHDACALAEVTGFADRDGTQARIRRIPVEGAGSVAIGAVTCMVAGKSNVSRGER